MILGVGHDPRRFVSGVVACESNVWPYVWLGWGIKDEGRRNRGSKRYFRCSCHSGLPYYDPLARNTLWCCRGRGLALLAVIRLGHICFTHVAHGSCRGVTQRQLRISS